MLTLNLQEVHQKLQEIKERPQPTISISIVPSDFNKPATERLPATDIETAGQDIERASVKRSKSERKELLLSECWKNFNDIKIDRAKLSNTIHDLVENGAAPAELRELYEKIEDFRPALEESFRIARHVEQYGQLPDLVDVPPSALKPNNDIFNLKDRKRKLIDKRSKLLAKIQKGKDPEQINNWKIELDYAVMEFDQVDEQIKKLEGKL